jgi:signal transduction histidine kinase
MFTSALKYSRWQKVFFAVCVLLLVQVIWWATVFLSDVNRIAELKMENAQLSAQISGDADLTQKTQEIATQAFHRRVMFLSEASFFLIMACVGMYLLLHALKVEQRSREIQRNFVEIISHESRTPLTALKLRLESIAEKRAEDSILGKELALARDEVKRLVSLFEKALSLNRLEREALQFEGVHPADTVREVIHRMDPLFRERQAKVSLSLDSDAVVRGDTHALQNLVQSILENGIFYNEKSEKRLEVAVRTMDNWVVISIEDNGPGIPESERERIFERFYRGKASGKVPGSGLGLYLARSLAEAHGGSIRYKAVADRGSVFEVILPKGEAV